MFLQNLGTEAHFSPEDRWILMVSGSRWCFLKHQCLTKSSTCIQEISILSCWFLWQSVSTFILQIRWTPSNLMLSKLSCGIALSHNINFAHSMHIIQVGLWAFLALMFSSQCRTFCSQLVLVNLLFRHEVEQLIHHFNTDCWGPFLNRNKFCWMILFIFSFLSWKWRHVEVLGKCLCKQPPQDAPRRHWMFK